MGHPAIDHVRGTGDRRRALYFFALPLKPTEETMPATAYDVRNLPDPAKYDRLVELESPAVWWELAGPLAGLHLLNDVRVPYFERALGGFARKRILDVGCGGGIFSEALARGGADVVGFDASRSSIQAARDHAERSALRIDYRIALAEEFDPSGTFDAVAALDVLEHVENIDQTLDMRASALAPGGAFLFLTHQRLAAFQELIWNGEYRVGLVPKGNHDFHKFIAPDDLAGRIAARGLKVTDISGLAVDVRAPRVVIVESTEVSYIGHATKGSSN
jgi:2-polyprenyl-6-hydroxyphenyl methylase / 3-demethylubiquinone-9 3-methyltransferase